MLIFLFFLVVGRFYTFEEAHRIDSSLTEEVYDSSKILFFEG